MAGQGSARVTLREFDLSAPTPVNRVLTGTPAGVVGRAKRGPAFVPTVFADIQEFQDTFGSFSDKGLDSNSNLYGPLAVSEWMSGNPGQGAFVRLLGVGNDANSPGFDVGTKQLGDNGSLQSNSFANNAVNVLGKTFMLGHFAKDATDSKYLSESGLSKFEITTIKVNNSQAGIDSGQTLIVTASGLNESPHTFTFQGNGTTSATIIQHNIDQTTTATAIKDAINLAFPNKIIATSLGDTVTLRQIVSNLSDSITVTSTTNAGALTITQDNTLDLFPLIRGILMTPHNVKATLSSTFTNSTTVPNNNNDANAVIGYQIGDLNTATLGFKLFLVGYTGDNQSIECSFDPAKSNYFANVLNKDPHKIEEFGHYLHSHYDINSNIIIPSNTGLFDESNVALSNVTHAFCISKSGNRLFEEYIDRFQTAVSPWIVSQDFGINSDGSDNDGMGDGIVKLFRLHALDDGEIGNNQVKIVISNLTKGEFGNFGVFDLSIEKFDSNPLKNLVLASWKRLSLDHKASNYIAKVIGNKRIYWDFDATKPGLQEEGEYPVTNKLVRVEVSADVSDGNLDASTFPCGFAGVKKLKTNNVFSETAKFKFNYLQNVSEPPVPMVRSIGRIKTGANDNKDVKIVPWGIKFGIKQNVDVGSDGFKEYTEQVFNQSIKSYTKYHPSSVWGPVTVSGSTNETLDYANDPNFFHLEKLYITCLLNDKLNIDNSKWGDALYMRDGIIPVSDSIPAADNNKRRFFRLSKDLSGVNSKYLSFTCFMQGGFDGLNIFDKEQHQMTNAACMKEALTTAKTGVTAETYKLGIDVYTDKAAAEIQLLAVPGIREPIVTNYAISAAEDRFDTLYIMDPELSNENAAIIKSVNEIPSVKNTINAFSLRALDTSFAATYFPDVIFNKPTGGSLKVPASVAVLGVLSRADNGGNTPWYAPAGINRGLLNASAAEFSISREQLDELYDNDINPIYIPAGRDQVHVFGQKTLLKNPSALDRINVRRLLIYIRRKVKNIANTFLFQPNRADTLKAFSAAVEPILAAVQQQQGIERYKVQIDTSTTTQSDVENNTIRGKIYLQPTKSIEFISLDFVVANSID